MEIKALIIDDEPLAQNVIKQYAERIPDLIISATCNEAICAHKILQEQEIDLLFLDINMPKLSGISFLKTLTNPPLVVFTTAYSEYALEGYELNAIDYLKKPFSFERFYKAYSRAQELFQLKNRPTKIESESIGEEYFYVKANKKTIKVNFSDIVYIEGLGDYIKIHLNTTKLVTNLSMKKMADLLPNDKFYRIHKSFIISLDKINSLEGNMVSVQGNKLPVGNSYRQDFSTYIARYMAD
jgi:DNA-binding LytR/AlgR family response regulator